MDITTKELETKLSALEDDLIQRGHNLEVEQEYLITKGELECWEKREESRLAQIVKRNG